MWLNRAGQFFIVMMFMSSVVPVGPCVCVRVRVSDVVARLATPPAWFCCYSSIIQVGVRCCCNTAVYLLFLVMLMTAVAVECVKCMTVRRCPTSWYVMRLPFCLLVCVAASCHSMITKAQARVHCRCGKRGKWNCEKRGWDEWMNCCDELDFLRGLLVVFGICWLNTFV